MKRGVLLKLAGILSICLVNQAFSWHFTVTNRTNILHWVECVYPGCRNNKFYIEPGETIDVDAYECLLTEIMVHNHPQIPYTSSGQRWYKSFQIIGPINGFYHVGRFE